MVKTVQIPKFVKALVTEEYVEDFDKDGNLKQRIIKRRRIEIDRGDNI